MNQEMGNPLDVQVTNLVLDPFTYHDVFITPAREGRLDSAMLENLGHALPIAIAQLDAIGDAYGALALAGLYHQLVHSAMAA